MPKLGFSFPVLKNSWKLSRDIQSWQELNGIVGKSRVSRALQLLRLIKSDLILQFLWELMRTRRQRVKRNFIPALMVVYLSSGMFFIYGTISFHWLHNSKEMEVLKSEFETNAVSQSQMQCNLKTCTSSDPETLVWMVLLATYNQGGNWAGNQNMTPGLPGHLPRLQKPAHLHLHLHHLFPENPNSLGPSLVSAVNHLILSPDNHCVSVST